MKMVILSFIFISRFESYVIFWNLYTAISINVVGSKRKAERQESKVMWDFHG